jgi:hypothetical protein
LLYLEWWATKRHCTPYLALHVFRGCRGEPACSPWLNLMAFFWFPRAGVGTDSGRASVLWVTRRWRVANAFPRQRVGTRKQKDVAHPTWLPH